MLVLTRPDAYGDFPRLTAASSSIRPISRKAVSHSRAGFRTDRVVTLNTSLIVKEFGRASEAVITRPCPGSALLSGTASRQGMGKDGVIGGGRAGWGFGDGDGGASQVLYQWRAARRYGEGEARIGELERLVGRQQADLDFFREALRSWDARGPRERRAHLFAVIEKMTREGPQGEIDAPAGRIAHLCSIALAVAGKLLSLARTEALGARRHGICATLIQRLALKRRHEGYRRITRRLRDEGLVGQRQARAQAPCGPTISWACAGGRSLRPRPESPPSLPDRAQSRARTRSPPGLDQLWVADIILGVKPEDRLYVRLAEAFVYLAVVIDAFSRRVVGMGARRPSRGAPGRERAR